MIDAARAPARLRAVQCPPTRNSSPAVAARSRTPSCHEASTGTTRAAGRHPRATGPPLRRGPVSNKSSWRRGHGSADNAAFRQIVQRTSGLRQTKELRTRRVRAIGIRHRYQDRRQAPRCRWRDRGACVARDHRRVGHGPHRNHGQGCPTPASADHVARCAGRVRRRRGSGLPVTARTGRLAIESVARA
jgi:hypothetical protein